MKFAYVDESGNSSQSDVFVMVGSLWTPIHCVALPLTLTRCLKNSVLGTLNSQPN